MSKNQQDQLTMAINMECRGMDDAPDAKPRAKTAIEYNYLDKEDLMLLEQHWIVTSVIGLHESAADDA